MRRDESHFAFLNRVDTPYWHRVRELLESWFEHYPVEAQPDLVRRFRSSRDEQHVPAFWELYLHEALRRDRWQLDVHPALPSMPRRLDFLATRCTESFFLEATAIVRPLLTAQQQRLLQTVLKAIDGISTNDFSLGVDYRLVGTTAPSTRELRQQLAHWLASLDRVAVLEVLAQTSAIDACPKYHWTPSDDWHLLFRAFPLRAGSSARAGFRAIGMSSPGKAHEVNHDGPLRDKLAGKLQGLKEMPHPLVVAVLDVSEYPLYPTECDRVLYGQTMGVVDPVTLQETHAFRADDGFWSPASTGSRAIAGVLVASRLRPWSICGREGATPVLWLNPNPTYELPPLPWPTYKLGTDGFNEEPLRTGKPMNELFGVSPEWPGPGPAFPR